MREQALGRVLDPRALDEGPGARGRLRIQVPAAWLARASRIAIVSPRRVACARCDGGGCDGCGRSGVLLAPEAEDARRIEVTLPGACVATVALRLTNPFGSRAGIAQLIVEIRAGEPPTPGVSCFTLLAPPERAAAAVIPWRGIALAAVAAAVAILAALLSR